MVVLLGVSVSRGLFVVVLCCLRELYLIGAVLAVLLGV